MIRHKLPKIVYFIICFLLIFEQSGFAQVAAQLDIAGHLSAMRSALTVDKFRPLHLRYLQYDQTQNNFRLLIDKGTLKNPSNKDLENTSKDLLKYFFIGLSLPNDSFWVNLRPDSPDNIIDDKLAQTDIGRILLEADLELKKDTARATSPETPEGQQYWNKLYQKAEELFGSQNVTIPTLTRPWIVPDEIIIRETTDSAYIYKATLKVMLEQDYLKNDAVYNFKDDRLKQLNEYSSQLIRELIIPKLTKEVNTSKKYAALRQVYYSLILAQWFKARHQGLSSSLGPARDKQGTVPDVYSRLINSRDLTNLTSKEFYSKETYFKAYQKSFKDGEYNFQTPVSTPFGQVIRSYFSGGFQVGTLVPQNPGTTTSTLGGGSTTRMAAQSGDGFLRRARNFLASVLVLIGSANAANPAEMTILPQEKQAIELVSKQSSAIPVVNETSSIYDLLSGRPNPAVPYAWHHIKGTQIHYVAFLSIENQDSAFDRLGLFVESKINSGRVLNNRELRDAFRDGGETKGVGYDYRIADMCRFFTAAEKSSIILNELELSIRNDLLRLGFIAYKDGGYVALKNIAVISSSPEVKERYGKRFMRATVKHEYRHGLYMTDSFTRQEVSKAWNSLSSEIRKKIAELVSRLAGYDSNNDGLIISECYAHLMDDTSGLRYQGNDEETQKALSSLQSQFIKIEEQGARIISDEVMVEEVNSLLKIFNKAPELAGFKDELVEVLADGMVVVNRQAVREVLEAAGIAVTEALLDEVSEIITLHEVTEARSLRGGKSTIEAQSAAMAAEAEALQGKSDELRKAMRIIWQKMHRGSDVDLKKGENAWGKGKEGYGGEGRQVGLIDRAMSWLQDRLGRGRKALGIIIQFPLEGDQFDIIRDGQRVGYLRYRINDEFLLLDDLIMEEIPDKASVRQDVIRWLLGMTAQFSGSRGLTVLAQAINDPELLDALLESNLLVDMHIGGMFDRDYLSMTPEEWRQRPKPAYLSCNLRGQLSRNITAPSVLVTESIPGLRLPDDADVEFAQTAAEFLVDFLGFDAALKQEAADNLARNFRIEGKQKKRGGAVDKRWLRVTVSSSLSRNTGNGKQLGLGALTAPFWAVFGHECTHFLQEVYRFGYSEFDGTWKRESIPYAVSIYLEAIGYGVDIQAVTKKMSSRAKAKILTDAFILGYQDAFMLEAGPDFIKAETISRLVQEHFYSARDEEVWSATAGALIAGVAFKRYIASGKWEDGRDFIRSMIRRDGSSVTEGQVTTPSSGSSGEYEPVNSAIRRAYSEYDRSGRTQAAAQTAAQIIVDALKAMDEDYHIDNIQTAIDILRIANNPQFSWALEILERYASRADHRGIARDIQEAISQPGETAAGEATLAGAGATGVRALGGIDPSLRSASMPPTLGDKGGIDFRALPIVTQAIGNIRASLGTVPLARQGSYLAGTVPVDLAKEWAEIERMVNAGITPSAERIKEYVQASCAKGQADQDVDKVINCISDILRQEEELCCSTDATLRDILVVLESARSGQELKEVFVGKI
jgi:hypothetical protein